MSISCSNGHSYIKMSISVLCTINAIKYCCMQSVLYVTIINYLREKFDFRIFLFSYGLCEVGQHEIQRLCLNRGNVILTMKLHFITGASE